jgi:hypothetical protein
MPLGAEGREGGSQYRPIFEIECRVQIRIAGLPEKRIAILNHLEGQFHRCLALKYGAQNFVATHDILYGPPQARRIEIAIDPNFHSGVTGGAVPLAPDSFLLRG